MVRSPRRHANGGERPRQLFGYVAGNSALDNGAGDDSLSGCDTEISASRRRLLRRLHLPIARLAGPAAEGQRPLLRHRGRSAESYNDGVDVEVGRKPSGDLMIFQGPVAIDWQMGGFEEGALENSSPPHPRRLAGLLAGNVHVAGRPEWIFVKTHTHAMQNRASFLSDDMDAMYEAMETWWNRPPFRLHYVTAREAYNIVEGGGSRLLRRPQ